MEQIKFGANYVPPKGWFYSWVDFEKSHIEEDFFALKAIGLDHLRVHLRWDLFQPATNYVAESMLKKLIIMHDIAEKVGLKLIVSVFTGWMSGLWFLPAFTRPRSENINIITNREMIEAEKYFLKKISEAVGGHPAFAGIDFGNELNVYEMFLDKFTVEQGDAWLVEMTDYCKDLFPEKIVVLGVDHNPWFRDVQFSRSCLANTGNITSLHTWTQFTGALAYGVESVENLSLIEYNVEMANAYARDIKRPVWVQEFGTIKEWMREDQFESFLKISMKNACRSENLWGFTVWCSHEFENRFVDVVDWETEFGLLTKDNQLKPIGRYYKEAIKEIKRGEVSAPLKNEKAIVIEEKVPFSGWIYGEAFANYVRKGEHVKFVLSTKADDCAYLEKRGIKQLIRL